LRKGKEKGGGEKLHIGIHSSSFRRKKRMKRRGEKGKEKTDCVQRVGTVIGPFYLDKKITRSENNKPLNRGRQNKRKRSDALLKKVSRGGASFRRTCLLMLRERRGVGRRSRLDGGERSASGGKTERRSGESWLFPRPPTTLLVKSRKGPPDCDGGAPMDKGKKGVEKTFLLTRTDRSEFRLSFICLLIFGGSKIGGQWGTDDQGGAPIERINSPKGEAK